jgi:hypothetical protein
MQRWRFGKVKLAAAGLNKLKVAKPAVNTYAVSQDIRASKPFGYYAYYR